MLKQGSIPLVRSGSLSRERGHLAVVMCFYPRGLKKELVDEYLKNLAPDEKLFKDWQKEKEVVGHERAFAASHYEDRFSLSKEALENLRRLSELSREKDVYLICQCDLGKHCHREILLLLAEKKFAAKIGTVFHRYPTFLAKY